MERLTEASEQRLTHALNKVATLVAEGGKPDDAIVKVASAERIPAGQVRLMAHAYNNGRTIGHLQDAGDLTEKASSFPLADPVAILERMFPTSIKTAQDAWQDTAVSEDYSRSPQAWLQRRDTVEKRAAAGRIDLREAWGLEAPPEPLTDIETGARRAVSTKLALKKQAAAKRQEVVTAGYNLGRAFDKLVGYFSKSGSYDFEQVSKNAALVLGGRAERLFQKIAREYPHLTKTAQTSTARWFPDKYPRHNVDWEVAPYSLVAGTLGAIDEFVEKKAAALEFEKEASAQAEEAMRPFAQAPERSAIGGSIWDSLQSRTEKRAVGAAGLGVGAAIAGGASGIAKKFAPKSKEELVQDRMRDLAGTEHEQRLREIQTQAMLHDMMLNDPVISGYEPDQVVGAYNQVSELAPATAHRRILLQALLRKHLEQGGALDLFEGDQTLELEKKLRRITDQETEPQVKTDVAA